MMCNGGLAASAAYFIGLGLAAVMPDDAVL
jgi:hypothetical protein